MASSFKRFVGLRGNDFTLVKSHAAGEILKAVVGHGWLSEASVPSCFPHNPHLEREIRSFQEVARSLFLQQVLLHVHSCGRKLAVMRQQLWPLVCIFITCRIPSGKLTLCCGSHGGIAMLDNRG